MSDKVFYQLLQEVGTLGKYQNNMLVLWSLFFLTCGSTTYYNSFLFYTGEYICPNDSPDCSQYVCNLPKEQRGKFIDPHFSSIATRFKYDSCDSNTELELAQAFIYFGGVIGLFAGSIINQYLSKRKLLILTTILSIFGLCLTIIADSIYMAAFGLFLNFSTKSIATELIPCYITETVGEESRGKHVMIIYLFFAFGATFNGLVFMVFHTWQAILIFYQLIPYCIFLGGLVFYIEETPFDSIVSCSAEESFQAFRRIAAKNGKQNGNGLTLESVSNVKIQYQHNQTAKHKKVISFLDLFRYDSLRTISILCILLHFFISFEFNFPELSVQDYALNIYQSAIILGCSEIVSSTLCIWMVDHFQRKRVMLVASALGVIISIPILLFAQCNQSAQCGAFLSVMQIAGLSLFRLLASIGYSFFCVVQCQVFPTQIRSIGSQITNLGSSTSFIITPFIQQFCKSKGISVIGTFVIACGLVFLMTLKMPETLNVPPPQMIKELEYAHKHQQLSNEAN